MNARIAKVGRQATIDLQTYDRYVKSDRELSRWLAKLPRSK